MNGSLIKSILNHQKNIKIDYCIKWGSKFYNPDFIKYLFSSYIFYTTLFVLKSQIKFMKYRILRRFFFCKICGKNFQNPSSSGLCFTRGLFNDEMTYTFWCILKTELKVLILIKNKDIFIFMNNIWNHFKCIYFEYQHKCLSKNWFDL